MSEQAAGSDESAQESGAASTYSAIASLRESDALRFVEQMNDTDLTPMLNAASLVDEIDPTPVLGAAARIDDIDPAPMLDAAALMDEIDPTPVLSAAERMNNIDLTPMIGAAALTDEIDPTSTLGTAARVNDIDLTPMLGAASLLDEIDPTPMLGAATRMNNIDFTPMLNAASLVDEIDPTPVLGAAARMDNINTAPMFTGIERVHDIDPTPMFAAVEAAENLDTAFQPTVNLAAQEIGQYPELAASVFDIVGAVSQIPHYQKPFITHEEPVSTNLDPESPGSEIRADQPTTGLANTPAIEVRRLIAEYIARARAEDDSYVELTNAQWISVSLAVGVVVGYCTDSQTGRAVSTALSVYGIAKN